MKLLMKMIRDVIGAFSLAYLGSLLLLLILQIVLPPEYGNLARAVLAILLFLSLPLLLLCLLVRLWQNALLLLIPVIAFVLTYGLLLLPRGDPTAQVPAPISVLTFNLQARTEEDGIDEFIDIITAADADVVGVQELSRDVAAEFHDELADLYPYRALYPQDNPHVGMGLLSRYPILARNFWRNQELEATLGHMRVRLDINGRSIIVYNTHPVPAFSFERRLNVQPHSAEISILLERAAEENAPVLLMGDFNMTPEFDEYVAVTERYQDAFYQAGAMGYGFTFPNGNQLPLPPIVRLDYVFYDEHFQALEAFVWSRSGPSDHLPLFARLSLEPS